MFGEKKKGKKALSSGEGGSQKANSQLFLRLTTWLSLMSHRLGLFQLISLSS